MASGRMRAEQMPGVLRAMPAAARAAEAGMVDRLRELVEVESPSGDKLAVDRAMGMVGAWCEAAGGELVVHRQEEVGDSLEAQFGVVGGGDRPVLLLGHLDTVWDVGTLAGMPWREEAGRIGGPGVLDMKAGVVMAVTAIDVLRELGLPVLPVILLLHGDEEIGSPGSRGLTERLAAGCRAAYVLEPGEGTEGAYKTARKGVGSYRVEVTGVAAHAGVDFGRGHSATLELARQVERLAGMSDAATGVTVNVGVMGGGTRGNVVAAEAWAEVDVRLPTMVDAVRVDGQMRGLAAVDAGCSVRVRGGLNRPPMERSAGTAALFRRAAGYAAAMGFALGEAATGGGSDGNFTAAMGVPTMDGMGAVGGGAHAAEEHVLREWLAPRTALLAAMLLDADEAED